MVKVKVIAAPADVATPSFNHPMVKVKVTMTTRLLIRKPSFNHPMVKVKEIKQYFDKEKVIVSTTLW